MNTEREISDNNNDNTFSITSKACIQTKYYQIQLIVIDLISRSGFIPSNCLLIHNHIQHILHELNWRTFDLYLVMLTHAVYYY